MRASYLSVVEQEGPGGDAPVVVLVHGSMDRSTSFARVRGRLSDLHVVTYDRRGYHRSQPRAGDGPAGGTLADHVEDLLGVLDGRAAVVAGHSFGANVALAAAAAEPTLVKAVVAYEPPMPWLRFWPSDSAGGVATRAATPEEAAERFMRRVVGDSRWERLPARTKEARRKEGAALVLELSSLREGWPFDPAAVAVPVVVGCGERSEERHRRAARYLAERLPHAYLVEVEGAGHGAHVTHPDAFADLVRRALAASGLGTQARDAFPTGPDGRADAPVPPSPPRCAPPGSTACRGERGRHR